MLQYIIVLTVLFKTICPFYSYHGKGLIEINKQQEKTKRKFEKALLSLCSQKNYFSITISDICNVADMHKSSFYRYYDSKDILIREIEDRIMAEVKNFGIEINIYSSRSYSENILVYKSFLKHSFLCAHKNKDIYKVLLQPGLDPHFEYLLTSSMKKGYQNILASNNLSFGDKHNYTIDFLTTGFMAVLRRFVSDDISFSEIEEQVYRMFVDVPLKEFTVKKNAPR